MDPPDDQDDAAYKTGMPNQGDDQMDTKDQEEPEQGGVNMEDKVQDAPGSTARPVAQLKASGGEPQGTPKGRMQTLVDSTLLLPRCSGVIEGANDCSLTKSAMQAVGAMLGANGQPTSARHSCMHVPVSICFIQKF